jgi:hypothetical protein
MAEKLHVGQGHYNGAGLTVFPVWLESPEISGHCWKASHLRVGELEAGASVNNLVITNAGHRPHIALEGDIFEGGRQNRMLAQGQVIARGERREVSVACVEEGRWHGAGEHRGGSRRATYGVRFSMSEAWLRSVDLDVNPQFTGVTSLAQSEVWSRIRRHESERGNVEGHSLMESMTQMDARRAPERSTAVVLPGQRGVIIGIGGYIAAAELFGSTSGLNARWEGILAAARYESMATPRIRTTGALARDFAASLERTPIGVNLPAPIALGSRQGPLAISSFALGFGLIHAAVFNGAHPALAGA